MTPTALSLRLLRSWNFHPAVVERWLEIPDPVTGRRKKIRKDCYGGFDLLAVDVKWRTTWLIQTTSLGNLSSRVKKLRGLPVMVDLIRAGVVCECWGWVKRSAKWQVKRVRIEGDALDPVEVTPKRKRVKAMRPSSLFD